jgi:hypothetical protein
MDEDMRKTIELPVFESLAQVYETDPEGVYSHRCPLEDTPEETEQEGTK